MSFIKNSNFSILFFMDKSLLFYFNKFNLDVKKATEITHLDAISSNVYKLELENETLILKILFNNLKFSREYFFLDKLKNKFCVPKIADFFNPNMDKKGAILMEYIDGDILNVDEFDDDLAFDSSHG